MPVSLCWACAFTLAAASLTSWLSGRACAPPFPQAVVTVLGHSELVLFRFGPLERLVLRLVVPA